MLVVSRKADESIVIETGHGEPIEIKLLSVDNQVRVGISAPNSCKIWRKELYTTVQSNRCASEKTSVGNLRSLSSKMETENNTE